MQQNQLEVTPALDRADKTMHKVCSPYQSAQTACMKMDCHCRELSLSSSPSIGLLSPLSSLISLASTLSLSLSLSLVCMLVVCPYDLSVSRLPVCLSVLSLSSFAFCCCLHASVFSLRTLSALLILSLQLSLSLSLLSLSFCMFVICHVCCLSPPQTSVFSLRTLSALLILSLQLSLSLSLLSLSFCMFVICHVCCLSPPQTSAWCIMAVELLRTSMSYLSSIVDWHVHFAGILLVCPSHVTSGCRLPLHSLLFLVTVH